MVCEYCDLDMADRGEYYICNTCGAMAFFISGEWVFTDPEDDDDSKPIGCTACGNPDYPDCKWSCNLIDE